MAQKILCPQCEKRYEIPDDPPAQATCKVCGTLMDLTAFGGRAQPPAAPASAPAGRASRGAGRVSRGPAAPPPRAARRPDGNGGGAFMLLLVGVTIVVLMIIVAVKRSGHEERAARATPAAPPAVESPWTRPTLHATGGGRTQETPPAGLAARGVSRPARPAETPLGEDVPDATAEASAAPRLVKGRDGKPRVDSLRLTAHAWPAEVDAGTRAQVEEALGKLYAGGRDGVEAQDWLVAQGRPIGGRLITEFRTIEESPGFGEREGASRASVIDATLRRMDGQVERFWDERERIGAWGAFGSPQFITRIAQRWTWWWTSGEWKHNPRAPWDPATDESDATPDGIKRAEPKKEDPKDTSWGKRAGG